MSDFTPPPAMVEAIGKGPAGRAAVEYFLSAAMQYLSDPKNAKDSKAWAEATMEQFECLYPFEDGPDYISVYRVKAEQ